MVPGRDVNRQPFGDDLGRLFWAEPKGLAKQHGGAKPREDGPSETIFADPPKMVFEGVT